MGIESIETAPARPVPITMTIFPSHEMPSAAYDPPRRSSSPRAKTAMTRITRIPGRKHAHTIFLPFETIRSARRTRTRRAAVASSTLQGAMLISHRPDELRGHRRDCGTDHPHERQRVQPDSKDEEHEQRQGRELHAVGIAEGGFYGIAEGGSWGF